MPSALNGAEPGQIWKLYPKIKYRADVKLHTGQILEKVRLPGPYYGSKGFQSGFKHGFVVGQFVLVEFLQNRRDNPIVTKVYPFPGNNKTKKNLESNNDYDPAEISVGHESGHKTIWADQGVLKHIDKTKAVRFQIDVNNAPTVNSLEKCVQGQTLKSQLETLIDTLKAMNDAIKLITVTCSSPGNPSSVPVNSATFTSLNSDLTTSKNNLSKILSEVVKHF
ncbi:MAG: hypothetical protein HS129_05080 [Leptospiraceae bacterium]|nr:hypothetical protein [Leptospiraceae bacterium]NUM41969.1 hypothetical protein [Leptospiraceae bacterium]